MSGNLTIIVTVLSRLTLRFPGDVRREHPIYAVEHGLSAHMSGKSPRHAQTGYHTMRRLIVACADVKRNAKIRRSELLLFGYVRGILADHEHVISVSIRNTAQYTSPLFVQRSLYAGLRTTIFHIRLIHKEILKTLVRSPHVIHLSIYPNHRLHNGLREILRIVHCKRHIVRCASGYGFGLMKNPFSVYDR